MAIPAEAELHVPPVTELESEDVAPTQTVVAPVIVPAVAVPETFTVAAALEEPQLLVTV